jgi:UDP-N-acetylglucosamine 4,6-dehydratase/5-epimerase
MGRVSYPIVSTRGRSRPVASPRSPPISDSETIRGRRILVTGGSGTIGSRLVDRLVGLEPDVVRVFGRDETKQFYQRHRFRDRPDVRFLIGDIRDRDRLARAMEGIDIVFHCAALKHVESGEYNPFEATQTNVVGTQNVIDACLAAEAGTMILTSSDKAANPTSVMGASKLLAEKLVSAATNYRGHHRTVFASVRFGNVLGSRGSALELFARQVADGGPVTVTDPTMSRFVMTTDRAVELAILAARIARGGEVFVFKMPVARLDDLVRAAIETGATANGLDPASIERVTIDPRPGEKPFEELMTEDESSRAFDVGDMYAVLPSIESHPDVLAAYRDVPPAPVGAYRSDHVEPLDAESVRRMVAETLASDGGATVVRPGVPR